MKVQLLQIYSCFNKTYLPGEYELESLPLSIRNNKDYISSNEIKESDKEEYKPKVVPNKRKPIEEDNAPSN